MEADIMIYWAAVMHMHTKSGWGAREKLRKKSLFQAIFTIFYIKPLAKATESI